MKDQYFGDINDYRKYGLLRSLIDASQLRLLVAWMLTPDDCSTDGKFISYLAQADKWAHFDPPLFATLKDIVTHQQQRSVSLLEKTDLLPNATYFSDLVPDAASARQAWFSALASQAMESDLVFLDPDNGLEIKSRPYGRKHSSKFLYWREVKVLWIAGKSLLMYQHYIREKRINYIQRMLQALQTATPGSFVEAFSTKHVVFLLALQPAHQPFHPAIVKTVQANWAGQIDHWALTQA